MNPNHETTSLSENLPSALLESSRLVRWRNIVSEDKLRKSPCSVDGIPVGYADERARVSVDDIEALFDPESAHQLGITLLDGMPVRSNKTAGWVWCLDFDGFIELGTGRFEDGVSSFLDRWPSYAEVSPSRTGFKYFFVTDRSPTTKWKIPFGQSSFVKQHPDVPKYKKQEVEVFSQSFFLTLTGDLIEPMPPELRFYSADEFDGLLTELSKWSGCTTSTKGSPELNEEYLDMRRASGTARLSAQSLRYTLSLIDHFDEPTWSNVAIAVARDYGKEGREYFRDYSSGELSGTPYPDYEQVDCDRRYDRALRDSGTRPDGPLNTQRLISMASEHPDWDERRLVFTSESVEAPNVLPLGVFETLTGAIPVEKGVERVQVQLPAAVDRADIRNGERFRDLFKNKLLFVRDCDWVLEFVPEQGWVRANSDVPMTAAKSVVASMAVVCGEAISAGRDAKAMLNEIKRASTRRALEDMLKLARSEEGMSVDLNRLDQDPYLLGVRNGVVDLKTSKLLKPTPDRLVTKYCNVDFDPEASCPAFDAFLERVVPSEAERQFLLVAMGYCLTGLTSEQLWFFLHGVGANGKSVLVGLLELLMGDYAAKIQTESLMQQPRGGSAAPELLGLQGKRLVFANETQDGQRLDDARIKDLTGGDSLTGRWLYSNNTITFKPNFKLLMVGNYVPTVSDNSHGFWRRIVLFPFNVTIPPEEQDKRLATKLASEASGILNLLLKSLGTYWNEGLRVPQSLRQATNSYRSDQDLIQQFIDDRCKSGPDRTITKASLYEMYRLWCLDNGCRAVSSNRLSRNLTAKGFEISPDKRKWQGLSSWGDSSIALMR